MEALLLGIYAFFVWLIFIKFKWLPWNTTSQVIVVIIPIVGMVALILLLNVFAPSSADVRVFKKSEGLTWLDSAGRTFTLSWSELKEWAGERSQAGRLAPKGFPRSNKFGPSF